MLVFQDIFSLSVSRSRNYVDVSCKFNVILIKILCYFQEYTLSGLSRNKKVSVLPYPSPTSPQICFGISRKCVLGVVCQICALFYVKGLEAVLGLKKMWIGGYLEYLSGVYLGKYRGLSRGGPGGIPLFPMMQTFFNNMIFLLDKISFIIYKFESASDSEIRG